ncbi:hypothetical protein R6Q59_012334 [Mikania micrantha]
MLHVDKLDVSSMQILGRQGPIEVNQEADFRLLGIPNRGIDLKTLNPTRNLSTKFQEWRKLYPNEYISPSELVKRLGEARDDDSFNFKVDFLMLFIGTIVECHAHGKCKIDVLNYIGDETEICKINWCSYIVDCIERCKYGWLPNTKSPFKGALAILTLLYVDNVQCKGMNVDQTIPLIEFWNMEKLKQREVLELKEVSESGNLGTLMDLERMLEQTMSNKKKMELAIVKKFEDEPNNDMEKSTAQSHYDESRLQGFPALNEDSNISSYKTNRLPDLNDRLALNLCILMKTTKILDFGFEIQSSYRKEKWYEQNDESS